MCDIDYKPTNPDIYLTVGYEAEDSDITLEAYVEGCKKVGNVYGIQVKGEPAGFLLEVGNELHISISPRYQKRWFSRKFLELINFLLDKHETIYCAPYTTNKKVQKFAMDLGCKYLYDYKEYSVFQINKGELKLCQPKQPR